MVEVWSYPFASLVILVNTILCKLFIFAYSECCARTEMAFFHWVRLNIIDLQCWSCFFVYYRSLMIYHIIRSSTAYYWGPGGACTGTYNKKNSLQFMYIILQLGRFLYFFFIAPPKKMPSLNCTKIQILAYCDDTHNFASCKLNTTSIGPNPPHIRIRTPVVSIAYWLNRSLTLVHCVRFQ